MDIRALKRTLTEDEGTRLTVYTDTEGCLTVGRGHRVLPEDGLGVGDRIALWTCLQFLHDDIAIALTDCRVLFDHFEALPETAQQVLANMAFNLGKGRLAKFVKLRSAVARQDWTQAAAEMRNSKWATQVKGRAERLAIRMESLAHA